MKNRFLLIVTLLSLIASISYSAERDSIINLKSKVDFSGFLRVDYWYDTRQIIDAVDGLFMLYPKEPLYDANNKDINQSPSLSSLAVATRLRSNIVMPDIFKAKSNIFLEVDFTGLSSIVHFRLRHAYAKFVWESSSLLVGLTWHPMFATDVFPTVVSLNTGAPFQSFNRSPQLTFTYQLTKNISWSISAIQQSDSRSPGPNDYTSTYLKNAIVPNLNTLMQYNSAHFTVGAALDFKSLKPRLFTTSLNQVDKINYKTDERINTYSGMVFCKYKNEKLTVKLKGMYGQNLAEHLLIGGYAVSKLDSITGHEHYTSFNHVFTFGNITYGKKYQVGLFVGFAKNLGTNENIVSKKVDRVFARGANIDKLIRVAPSLTYTNEKFQFSFEVENTIAYYGDINITKHAKVENQTDVNNTRFLVVLQYSF